MSTLFGLLLLRSGDWALTSLFQKCFAAISGMCGTLPVPSKTAAGDCRSAYCAAVSTVVPLQMISAGSICHAARHT
jgi:hypothetical protein